MAAAAVRAAAVHQLLAAAVVAALEEVRQVYPQVLAGKQLQHQALAWRRRKQLQHQPLVAVQFQLGQYPRGALMTWRHTWMPLILAI